MAAALCLTVFPAMPVFADPADSTENTEDGGSSEEEKPDTSAIDAEIDRLKQEEKQVESQINSIKQQKNQTEGELSATQGQVSSLSGEQDQVAGQMNVTQDSIAQNIVETSHHGYLLSVVAREVHIVVMDILLMQLDHLLQSVV